MPRGEPGEIPAYSANTWHQCRSTHTRHTLHLFLSPGGLHRRLSLFLCPGLWSLRQGLRKEVPDKEKEIETTHMYKMIHCHFFLGYTHTHEFVLYYKFSLRLDKKHAAMHTHTSCNCTSGPLSLTSSSSEYGWQASYGCDSLDVRLVPVPDVHGHHGELLGTGRMDAAVSAVLVGGLKPGG